MTTRPAPARKGGSRRWDEVSVREEEQRPWDRLQDVWDRYVEPILRPVWDFVTKVIDVAIWVLEKVAQVYGVPWERWVTHGDERVCPECGPLHGMTWEEGDGESPPLHGNCRCAREYAFTEWRTRWVDDWRLRWTREESWGWELTGWR